MPKNNFRKSLSNRDTNFNQVKNNSIQKDKNANENLNNSKITPKSIETKENNSNKLHTRTQSSGSNNSLKDEFKT